MSNQLRIPEGDLNLLREFQRYRIPFVIIGGYAVRFHGVERGVDDLDVAVDSAGRSEDLAKAILDVAGVSVNDNAYLEKPYKQVILKNIRLCADILTSIKGVEFAEAYQSAHVVEVEGVTVRVIRKAAKRRSLICHTRTSLPNFNWLRSITDGLQAPAEINFSSPLTLSRLNYFSI